MLTERLKQLGLYQDLALNNNVEYQRQMAVKLRALTFAYLQGTLTDVNGEPIPDGPIVKQLREDLQIIGGLDHFVRTQSPNGAWAGVDELTLLTELLGVNFVVQYAETGRSTVLTPEPSPVEPTFVLMNTRNAAWDPVINGQKYTKTVHEGDCGYTSVAVLLRQQVQSETSPTVTPLPSLDRYLQEENKFFKRTCEQYQQEALHYKDVFNAYSDEVKDQIESDRRYALRLALADLPGVAGRPSRHSLNPYGLFAHTPLVNPVTVPQPQVAAAAA